LRDVSLRYFGLEGETEALNGISISIKPGEFVAIIGQSGCGKSTLLSLISGILMPTGGAVLVDGKPVTGPSRKVGYMLQQDYLFEWRTILENAVLGAEIQNADMNKARPGCSPAMGSANSCTICRGNFPVACASALRLRARCARSPTSSCSMSLSRRSIHRRGLRWPTKLP
jgi:NitT/TauT family transport system ATP-binding protein